MPRNRILSTTTPISPYDMASSYDSSSASSASTSLTTPSPPSPCRLRRKRSPSPSSRASDIARLLDPAYARSTHYAGVTNQYHSHQYATTVYVDHNGEVHDPDFRHFPPVRKTAFAEYEEDAVEDEDEEEWREKEREQERERQRRRSSSGYASVYMPTYIAPYSSHHPTYQYSHYPRDDVPEDVMEDEDEDQEHEGAPLQEKHHRRSASAPPSSAAQLADGDFTPSCTHSLRRQWHALALGLRFSLFRTKRRIRRRIGG
ncbi:hypothetical protein BJ138DRAFT_1098986 [Hygrophoropsis aurantiaca]|uniref:Uncharacterized protein n=1 Tax=Hygrophoropsis aurantiaca TaxID=72124 RepID=A0ACB8ALX3_9AGAM|nr:hypothetical protein BJ138DRAFT_1098986 [Hygrophoropsis aurantiaca]